jgi:hypothetical protein
VVKFIQRPIFLGYACMPTVTKQCCRILSKRQHMLRCAVKLRLQESTVQAGHTVVGSDGALQSHCDMTGAVSNFGWITEALKVWILRCAQLACRQVNEENFPFETRVCKYYTDSASTASTSADAVRTKYTWSELRIWKSTDPNIIGAFTKWQ